MSFIIVMRVVADLTAASCSAIEFVVLLLCFDDAVEVLDVSSRGGLLFVLSSAIALVRSPFVQVKNLDDIL